LSAALPPHILAKVTEKLDAVIVADDTTHNG